MRASGVRVHAAIVTALLAWAAVPASAQDTPSGEFSAGWKYLQAMNVFGDADQSLPVGWYADVSGNVTDSVAIVGEMSGAYKSFEQSVTQLGIRIDAAVDVKLHMFLGGMRFSKRTPRVVPFAQVLFGLAVIGADIEGSATVGGATITVDESVGTTSEFALDAGGGVNFNFSDHGVGLRVQGSYIRVGGDSGGSNGLRVGAGVVVPF